MHGDQPLSLAEYVFSPSRSKCLLSRSNSGADVGLPAKKIETEHRSIFIIHAVITLRAVCTCLSSRIHKVSAVVALQ